MVSPIGVGVPSSSIRTKLDFRYQFLTLNKMDFFQIFQKSGQSKNAEN
jgi:hypothetical protein